MSQTKLPKKSSLVNDFKSIQLPDNEIRRHLNSKTDEGTWGDFILGFIFGILFSLMTWSVLETFEKLDFKKNSQYTPTVHENLQKKQVELLRRLEECSSHLEKN